jgi:sugar lactone lactonase YvrE
MDTTLRRPRPRRQPGTRPRHGGASPRSPAGCIGHRPRRCEWYGRHDRCRGHGRAAGTHPGGRQLNVIPTLECAQDTLGLAVDARATLGEGPRWDTDRGLLWWVDILAGAVHAYRPSVGGRRTLEIGGLVGAVALRASGGLVAALADRVVSLDPGTGAIDELVAFAPDPALRSNDAACDPAGRLWVDRTAIDETPGAASLIRIDVDRRREVMLDGLTMANGMDWSPDGRTMYFTDSTWGEVRAYPFDPTSGRMGEASIRMRLPDDGLPDGLTVDTDGCLWVAQWGAGRVVRLAPDGEVLGQVRLPVANVSSCTFGGADLGDLYITTAREGLALPELERQPEAGGLWRCRPGVRGRAPTLFAG